ncbi:hypothetical protein L3Q82_011116 [Scortum barcoo]|uniref:Uncharacterized protein n=1 Tax=Scortum barcoo TaxID=214431 RepID=A0ACB8W9F0_9TELE|nr:hypothetical protein L3Q82_011116 [Scortum barcoo]
MKKETTRTVTSPRIGVTGAPPWSQAWGWGSQASAWWPGLCPRDPGRAQPEMATWARLPVGSPPAGRSMRGRCNVVWVESRGGERWRAGVGLLIAPQLSRHVLEFPCGILWGVLHARWHALSWVGGEVLPQVEEFKYLGVLFTSEGKMEREIDRRIGAASAVMRSVYADRTVVVKKELSRKVKLSIYQVNLTLPPSTYGQELWVMTERTRSHGYKRPK